MLKKAKETSYAFAKKNTLPQTSELDLYKLMWYAVYTQTEVH